MTIEEQSIFLYVVAQFQETYPDANLRMVSKLVYADVYDRDEHMYVEECFNTDGYNLLYCLTKLTGLLKDKLR